MKTGDYSTLAPAKVNLFLHVGPVQANGRHPLDSLVMFAGKEAADRLSVMISDDLSMTITGPGMTNPDYIGPIHDNLVLRAARALQAETGTDKGAAFTLEKHLPVAAGIGGGSADAAAALRLLTGLWGTDPAAARKIAPTLGGDVPVALKGHAALMQGEGERVHRAPGLPRLPALLVNPNLACPTGPIFRAYDEAGGGAGFRAFGAGTASPACPGARRMAVRAAQRPSGPGHCRRAGDCRRAGHASGIARRAAHPHERIGGNLLCPVRHRRCRPPGRSAA